MTATKLQKNDSVKVVVDGEIFDGEVTQAMHPYYMVKIPFYYSLSQKHGKVVKNNCKSVKEHIEHIMF
jgi:hypothetical protein